MFYYVQRCYEPIIKEFSPRVPETRMLGENYKIKRICLSRTIEGCINAAPWGYSQIAYRNLNEVFRLYSFDSSKIPINNIIDTRAIYNCGYVDDAKFTKEVWVVNQTLIPNKIEYFKIGENIEEENVDVISYKDIRNNTISNTNCFGMVKNIEVEFMKEQNLFQGKEFHSEYMISPYRLDDVLPIEISYDYDDITNVVTFSEPVVFCVKDLGGLFS